MRSVNQSLTTATKNWPRFIKRSYYRYVKTAHAEFIKERQNELEENS